MFIVLKNVQSEEKAYNSTKTLSTVHEVLVGNESSKRRNLNEWDGNISDANASSLTSGIYIRQMAFMQSLSEENSIHCISSLSSLTLLGS